MPGWYGVGSALKSYTQNTPNKIQLLQRMHTEWPFFQGFVSAIQMSLSKADMPIALEYARLCKDPVTERLVYDLIKQEYDLTESQLLVTIQVSCVGRNVLRESARKGWRESNGRINHA